MYLKESYNTFFSLPNGSPHLPPRAQVCIYWIKVLSLCKICAYELFVGLKLCDASIDFKFLIVSKKMMMLVRQLEHILISQKENIKQISSCKIFKSHSVGFPLCHKGTPRGSDAMQSYIQLHCISRVQFFFFLRNYPLLLNFLHFIKNI